MGGFDIHTRRSFEDLNDRFLARDLKHLPATFRAIWEGELDDFVIGRKLHLSQIETAHEAQDNRPINLDIVKHHQRAVKAFITWHNTSS